MTKMTVNETISYVKCKHEIQDAILYSCVPYVFVCVRNVDGVPGTCAKIGRKLLHWIKKDCRIKEVRRIRHILPCWELQEKYYFCLSLKQGIK